MLISEVYSEKEILIAFNQAFSPYRNHEPHEPYGILDSDWHEPNEELMKVIVNSNYNPRGPLWEQVWDIIKRNPIEAMEEFDW